MDLESNWDFNNVPQSVRTPWRVTGTAVESLITSESVAILDEEKSINRLLQKIIIMSLMNLFSAVGFLWLVDEQAIFQRNLNLNYVFKH